MSFAPHSATVVKRLPNSAPQVVRPSLGDGVTASQNGGVGEWLGPESNREPTDYEAVSSLAHGVSARPTGLNPSGTAVSGGLIEPTGFLSHVPSVCHAEALLTLEEVAAWLSVAATVVEELVASGELRVLRIGQERRVRPADLEALLRTTEQ